MADKLSSRALSLLSKLISINSVFPNEAKIAKFCEKLLKKYGFQTELYRYSKNRYIVVAQKGKAEGSVLLTAHLDTVPPYNYNKNPFEMRIKKGKIYGLGSYDMKSGLAILLECAYKCKVTSRGLRVVLTSDEENISEGSWLAQQKGFFSNCSIGICHEIADSYHSKNSFTAANTYSRPPIIIGRRGRVVYRFYVSGIGGHGASCDGKSAIELSFEIIKLLNKMPLPKSKFGKASIFVRKIFSESTSLSLPVEAIFDLDCHYIPPYDANSFLLYITNYLKRKNLNIDYKIEIVQRKTPYLPAYKTSLNQKLVKQLLHLYKKEIGNYSLSFGLTVADENIISFAGTPVITIGLLGGNPHSSLEWVDKKDYLLLFEKMPKIVQGLLDA